MQKTLNMRILIAILLSLLSSQMYSQNNTQKSATIDFVNGYMEVKRLYCQNELDFAVHKLKGIKDSLIKSYDIFFTEAYILTMYSLSNIYAKQGKFKKSEKVLDEAEKTLTIFGKQEHPFRRLLIMQRGELFLMIDNIDRAKKLLLQSKRLFEKERDVASSEYAICLSNLALVFQKNFDYWFSNILLEKAARIIKNKTINNNIALNYYYMGDIEKANSIRDEILRKGDSSDKGNYLALVNSAYSYIQKGMYEEAIQLIDMADKNDYDFMEKDYAYQNLILSLYLSENKRSVDVLKQYIDYSKKNLSSVMLTYAESERENYWSQHSLILELVTNAVAWKYQTPELLKESYNITLFTKSLLCRLSKIIFDYAKNSPSNDITEKYNLLLSLKKKLITKGISIDSVTVFQERINAIERDLITSISNFREIFDDSIITCDNIRKELKPGEVAIEFVLFPEFQSGKESIGYYGALIERPEYVHPIFVKLCEFDSFDNVMDKGTLKDDEFIDSLYCLHNEKLYRLIFHPLEKYLHDGETIYFSPVSGLHKINMQAIPVNGQRLMDKYHLIEVSSTAQIIESNWRSAHEQLSDAFLIGGVNYSEDIENMVLEAQNYLRYGTKPYVAARSLNRSSWDPIPETRIEVQQIDSVLCHQMINTVTLSGGKASEEAFKNLDGNSPAIIHFATHGFFFDEKYDASTHYFDNINSYAKKRLPMQFCGLLLAGANNAWIGNFPPTNIEDGILTAEEISQMDLTNTNIAVLSACDTGLGRIDDIDGVYGLQRGFKMAGVKTIMMSLWKVHDEATRILMVEFYRNLMDGKTKHQSLKEAQKHLREVENGKYNDPKYWASFVMLDGLD